MHDALQQLAGGRLTPITIPVWTLLSIVLSIAAGALAGMQLAGKDLGHSLAALMGAMYGPVAAVPGILAGLIVLAFM
jgi:uncharacterized membrane protein